MSTAFTIPAAQLSAAVAMAASAAARSNAAPVLEHLWLRAARNTLQVRGTDMEMELLATALGTGDLPPCTVNAGVFAALLGKLPADSLVTLTVKPDVALEVVARGMAATLPTLPAEDFPAQGDWRGRASVVLPARTLLRLLTAPAHAISTEETRYYLNGILLQARGDGVAAVATDGHRLHLAEEVLGEDWPLPDSIVPRGSVKRMQQLLAALDGEREVTLRGDEDRMQLAAGDWTFTTKLIAGTFPDYARVIPAAGQAPLLVVTDGKALAAAVQTARTLGNERAFPVRLLREPSSGRTLLLQAQCPEHGSIQIEVPEEVAAWEDPGEAVAVGFQARYLVDLCGAMAGGFRVSLPGMSPARADAGSDIGVLMPMRA